MAAGSGSRMGALKQYEMLGDRRVLDWAIAGARSVADGVVVVVPADRIHEAEPDADAVVAGGDSRSDSVRSGLAAVPENVDVIFVHDAARPLASRALFADVVAAVASSAAAGAIPAIAVTDTVKRVDDGRVVATLDRAGLVAVQTPQAFTAGALRKAHLAGGHASDDAALVEVTGAQVVVVPGDPANRKLTTVADLTWARALVAERAAGRS